MSGVAILLIALLQGIPSQCIVDRDAALALEVKQFDQSPGNGWRAIAAVKGCEVVAADLIAEYRRRHAVDIVEMKPNVLIMLNFHEAQLRAAANQVDQAIALQKRAMTGEGQEVTYYNEATLAFLRRDLKALTEARQSLAAVPRPEWMPQGKSSWPTNLDVVDGLIYCFDRPYAEAYSTACRQSAK